MTALKRLWGPLGPLLAGLLGVVYGRALVEGAYLLPLALTVSALMFVALFFGAGRASITTYPQVGSYLMESGQALVLIAAAFFGGVGFWVLVELAPGKDATPLEKQTLSGISGALTTYLAAAYGKADLPWNPVKKAFKTAFDGCFSARRDDVEKDAQDSLLLESFGSATGAGTVTGWDWSARRVRARLLQSAVDRGYGPSK